MVKRIGHSLTIFGLQNGRGGGADVELKGAEVDAIVEVDTIVVEDVKGISVVVELGGKIVLPPPVSFLPRVKFPMKFSGFQPDLDYYLIHFK